MAVMLTRFTSRQVQMARAMASSAASHRWHLERLVGYLAFRQLERFVRRDYAEYQIGWSSLCCFCFNVELREAGSSRFPRGPISRVEHLNANFRDQFHLRDEICST